MIQSQYQQDYDGSELHIMNENNAFYDTHAA